MVEHASWKQLNGTTVGQYHLQRLLDQHPWGPIFLANDSSNQAYTVRFIGMPASSDQADLPAEYRLVYLGRFQQAANQLAALQHPHILPLLDYGSYQETPYLVSPYQKLTSLRSVLKSTPALDTITVGRLLEQLAEALSYAHTHGILHRNLSTLCIFTRPDYQLVIADFGLLHIREIHKQYFAAPTGALADGSSEASSPEQWLNKPIGTYADMYALGAVLYRLLTGHAPFEGNTRAEAMQKHLSAMQPAMSVWRSDLPPALDTLFAKALAKEPEQRFQRPEELLQAYWQIVSPEETVLLRPAPQVKGVGQAVYPLPPSPPSPPSPPIRGNAASPSSPIRGNAVSKSASLPRVPVASIPTSLTSKPGTTVKQQASRRRLFTLLALGGAGAVALLAVAESGLFHGPTPKSAQSASAPTPVATTRVLGTTGGNQGRVVARVADIPLNSAKTFPLNNGQPNPGIIVHLPDNRFVAFDSTCTHESCAVSYEATDHQLLCPCHSATFDPATNAAVTHGPAVTPLAPIKIRVNADGTITV